MNIGKYIGLKYKDKGRDITGIDCWGLVRLFYKEELGFEIPSYDGAYENSKDQKSVSQAIKENIHNWVSIETPEPGDLLVFQILGQPWHTGIFLGNNDFLHAFNGCNSCIERLNSITWNRRLLGVYRWIKN